MGSKSREIAVADIVVPPGRKRLSGAVDLSASIAEVGLANPITVTPDCRLIAGLRRLEAVKSLGWETVPCTVVDLDDLHAELLEIDENVARNEPNALERAELLKRRKEVYEAIHPETKAGAKRAHGMHKALGHNVDDTVSPTFADDTAAKTGLTPRTIQRDVQIASDLDDEAKEDLRETPVAGQKTALLRLAREDKPVQKAAAKKLKAGKAKSVGEAVDQARREQGAAPAPTDELGTPLPEREGVRQAFAGRPLFAKVYALQTQLAKALNELFEDQHASRRLAPLRQRLDAHYREARTLVRLYQPHAVCPGCGGTRDRCGQCGGVGWLSMEAWKRHDDAQKARAAVAGKGAA